MERLHILGARTNHSTKTDKSYGELSVGIEEPPGSGNLKAANIPAEPGIEKGFTGVGQYEVDGPMRFLPDRWGNLRIVMHPAVIRKAKDTQ